MSNVRDITPTPQTPLYITLDSPGASSSSLLRQATLKSRLARLPVLEAPRPSHLAGPRTTRPVPDPRSPSAQLRIRSCAIPGLLSRKRALIFTTYQPSSTIHVTINLLRPPRRRSRLLLPTPRRQPHTASICCTPDNLRCPIRGYQGCSPAAPVSITITTQL
ncbi:hypothetical protein OE88DRAFT_326283 [Heliocybe sulcata]|uniref:Uncharacterized protein n=1 Tax=Heliocybe sulcata TaxID=5364 RepID=A0A5C3N8J1_9AGAM|nr:hypothetical protein OE88DRAFT_326283 [Heliocybe sulcata]